MPISRSCGDGLGPRATTVHTLKRRDVFAAVMDRLHNAQQRACTDPRQKYDHVKFAGEKSRSKGERFSVGFQGTSRIEGATKGSPP